MEWKAAVKKEKDENTYQIPERWLDLHYYEALNILFRIENALRMLIYIVLKNECFEKWVQVVTTSDDTEQITIEAISKKRISQNQDFGYLGYPIRCPIMHLTSGELIRIIFSEKYWPLFKPYFKGKKEIMRLKLDEIGNVRNTLAHFRPLRPDDVEVIKQNAKQTLMEIESCLSGIVLFSDNVPTNTSEEWYGHFTALNKERFQISLKQNSDARWIKIDLKYSSALLNFKNLSSFKTYEVLKLNTPQILRQYDALRNYVTYVAESLSWKTDVPKEGEPDFSKTIQLVFRKSVLEKYGALVAANFQKLIEDAQQESDIIQKDHLARGKLLGAVTVWAWMEGKAENQKWVVHKDELICLFEENSPAEYWGKFDLSFGDVVSGTCHYPWMPVAVSKSEFPF